MFLLYNFGEVIMPEFVKDITLLAIINRANYQLSSIF